MKWSDIPISIEVKRNDSEWECVGRVRSERLACVSAERLWQLIYSKYEGAELRIVEAARESRKVLGSYK